MKRLSIIFVLIGLLFTASCGLQKEGLVLMTDQSYKASVFATNKMGFGSPDGSILVGDGEQHEVFRVTRDGAVSEFIGKEYGITRPEGLVYDDKGNLYIADEHFGKVYVYTPNDGLKPIATFAGSFKQLQGITVDDQGDLYVAVQTDLKHKVGHIIKLSKESTEVAAR